MRQWTAAGINAESWLPDEALAELRLADLLVLRHGCSPRIASAKVAPETASLSAVLETDRSRRGRSRDSGCRLQNQQRHGEQPGRIDLHLIAYAPEKCADATMVEDSAAVLNGEFSVRTAGRKINRAYLAPDRIPLEVETEGDYTRIKLPPFEGYALAVLEI